MVESWPQRLTLTLADKQTKGSELLCVSHGPEIMRTCAFERSSPIITKIFSFFRYFVLKDSFLFHYDPKEKVIARNFSFPLDQLL